MKLAYSPSSPYVRKVMAVLHETDQLDNVELVRPEAIDPFNLDKGLSAINPLAKVPALELSDGSVIYDSRVLCAYFNERARASLYGTGDFQWQIKTLEATAEGILDTAFIMMCEGRFRRPEIQFAEWVDAQWRRIEQALSSLSTRWIDHLNSSVLDMGQIAVACALGYLDLRHDSRNWRQGHEELAEWYRIFSARPLMVATRPPES